MEISKGQIVLKWIILLFINCICVVEPIGFTGAPNSYARYTKWNACLNASISFEFKTRKLTGLLMYTDDNGTYDFFEVMLSGGAVRLRLNIVDGRDGSVEFEAGNNLNDNRWHSVKITRNRMETTLKVDNLVDTKVAFGSDFNFGHLETNSDVFFGGVPDYHFRNDLKSLALPSVIFHARFSGEIRNVIYQNCSCMPVRASMIASNALDPLVRREQCEINNPCNGSLCVSTDRGPACKYVESECIQGE